jgi:hypothetical protein
VWWDGKTCVQVDDLGKQSGNDKDEQDIKEPLCKLFLRLSSNGGNNGGTETLGRDNAKTANQTTDGKVYQHRLFAVLGSQVPGDDNTGDDDDTGIAEEARRDDQMLHVANVGNGGLSRRIYDNNDGPNNAIETADLADKAQSLFEKYGGQDGAYDDG